jgi:hypothetical protein
MARELFAPGFVSCWSELDPPSQEQLVRSLEAALASPTIPPGESSACFAGGLCRLNRLLVRSDGPLAKPWLHSTAALPGFCLVGFLFGT